MAKIFHAHLHGDRVTKYDCLMESNISNTRPVREFTVHTVPGFGSVLTHPDSRQTLRQNQGYGELLLIIPSKIQFANSSET